MGVAAGTPCPWCGARLAGDAATCRACGATLGDGTTRVIPGVTEPDLSEALRARAAATRARGVSRIISTVAAPLISAGRLLGWLFNR